MIKESAVSPNLSQLNRVVYTFGLFSLFFVTTDNSQVYAEQVTTEEWNISADKIIRYDEPASIIAQGNVILEKKEKIPPMTMAEKLEQDSWADLLEEGPLEKELTALEVEQNQEPEFKTTMTIKADWMAYDVEMESIKAKGNLNITTEDDQLVAKEGNLNLATETGQFADATIIREEYSMHLEGKSIEKTGFDTYRIIDGWVITCKLEDGQTPPWSFASSRADIRDGGYAVMKNARFKIKDFPILYSPYMIVPVKNQRQTGFLLPQLSTSSNSGFGFNLPFFLNLSDSADATFHPEYYTERGLLAGLELRYATNENSKGMFTVSYLDDALSDPSETEYYSDTGYTHDNSERYWIRAKGDQTFGNWQSRLDLDIVSDQDYLKEFANSATGFESSYSDYLKAFGRSFQNQTEVNRQNTLKVLRTWSGISLEANLLGINEVSTEASDTDTPLWKLPSIDFTGTLPIENTLFTLGWDADYVNYWREDGVSGQRVDLHPSISTPIPMGAYLESRAEVSIRDTFYMIEPQGDAEWAYDDTQNRFIGEFETEIATTLEKDFFSTETALRTINHQLRPYLQYNYIPDVDQDELPYFDDVDRIYETNAFTYGLDNYFDIFKIRGDGQETRTDYLFVTVEQAYSVLDDDSDEPFSDVYLKIDWDPTSHANLLYKTYYDVYDSDFNSHSFEGNYTSSRGDSISLEYSFLKYTSYSYDTEGLLITSEAEVEQINGTLRANLTNGWFAETEIEHSISLDETIKANGALIYEAPCWSVKLETRYTEEDTVYMVEFNLANIGNPLGINF